VRHAPHLGATGFDRPAAAILNRWHLIVALTMMVYSR